MQQGGKEEEAHLEQLMQQGPFHSLVTAAATKPLLQHSLALTLEAASDPGAGQQQVWVQDHHACMISHLTFPVFPIVHRTATKCGCTGAVDHVLWQLGSLMPQPKQI